MAHFWEQSKCLQLRLGKHTMIAPYNGVLYSKEEEHTVGANDNTGKALVCCVE